MDGRSSRGGERGFALIEALASLTVVGMVSLMIVAGIGAARGAGAHLDASGAALDATEAAQSALRDRLEQIFPATLYDFTPQTVDFEGRSDGLSFVASPPDSQRPSALRRYTLSLDGGGDLVLASVSDVDPRVVSAAERLVLLKGVRSLEVAYFGPDPLRPEGGWRRLWRQEQLAPELIRIRVGFAPGDRRAWPDLIVHPRATIDAGCVININTHHCQGRA